MIIYDMLFICKCQKIYKSTTRHLNLRVKLYFDYGCWSIQQKSSIHKIREI